MWMLRVSLTCLVLSLMAVLFVPFAVAQLAAGIFGLLFVIFLVLGLVAVENLPRQALPLKRARTASTR